MNLIPIAGGWIHRLKFCWVGVSLRLEAGKKVDLPGGGWDGVMFGCRLDGNVWTYGGGGGTS